MHHFFHSKKFFSSGDVLAECIDKNGNRIHSHSYFSIHSQSFLQDGHKFS